MHRTSTTALLLTVLASAATGCVTVDPAPGPERPAPRGPQVPRPQGSGGAEEMLEAPAREALLYLGPSPEPTPQPVRPTSTAAATPTPAAPQTHEGARSPAHRTPSGRPRASGPALPSTEKELCALGDRFGALQPGSQAARICQGRQGR